MGSRGLATTAAASCPSAQDIPMSISELPKKHRMDLENLTLITTQPFRTLQFLFATLQYLKHSIFYVLTKGGWFMLLSILLVALGICVMTVVGTHEKLLYC